MIGILIMGSIVLGAILLGLTILGLTFRQWLKLRYDKKISRPL